MSICEHDECCGYYLCAHPACCGYYGQIRVSVSTHLPPHDEMLAALEETPHQYMMRKVREQADSGRH